MGLVNSIVLPEFPKELRELPWQPTLGKNKPKLHRLQFRTSYGDSACMYIVGFSWSGNTSMLIKILKERR